MGTQQELSNEYQHGRVKIVFKGFRILILLTEVVSALEGLVTPLSTQQFTTDVNSWFETYWQYFLLKEMCGKYHKKKKPWTYYNKLQQK